MKAVLFDVYETILTGRRTENPNGALQSVALAFGLEPPGSLFDRLQHEIRQVHEASPAPFPEVDIRECWKQLLPGLLDADAFSEAAERALRPVSLLPGAIAAITNFHRRGCALGIVSNAQAYTRATLEENLGDAWDCFDPELCSFSYETKIAKPDLRLFQRPLEVLKSRGVVPSDVMMIGDSFRNDIVPARALGLRTLHLNRWG